MNLAQRKREHNELMTHLLERDWDVFGTLKFVNGRTIGRNTADKLLRSYWNRIDRVFFGHAADRQNIRVPRWCFAHEGSDSENFHVHFVLLSPLADIEHACAVLNAIWTQHHPQTASLDKNWIIPVQSRTAVANYLTREYWRIGSATYLDQISWNATSATDMQAFVHPAQAQRIEHAASPQLQQAANRAFFVHLNKYKQIDDHL